MIRIMSALMLIILVMAGNAWGATAPAPGRPAVAKPAAVNPQLAQLKPLPKADKMTQAQYLAATKPVELNFPDRDHYLDLGLRIPKNWTERQSDKLKTLQTADRLFGEVAWYDAPGEGNARPFMSVRSVALDHEITAKAWLIQRAFDNAYALRSLNERSFSDVEALYITYDQLETYVTWARAVIMGPRVILVEFHLPSGTWAHDKDLQIWTMNALQFKGKDPGRIEELSAFAFLDVATFQYPKSWTLFRNIIRSPDFFRVALFNAEQHQTPTVQITVQAARIGGAVDLDTMKQEEQKFIEDQHVILRDPLPSPNFVPPLPDVKNAKTYVYNVSSKLGLYDTDIKTKPVIKEYWLTSFDRGNTAFVVAMLVPSRMGVYQDWARATRAYQIVIETLSGQLIGMKSSGSTPQNDGDTAIPFVTAK